MWSGDAMCGLGVWRCQSFASSWWFFLHGVSPVSSPRFYFRKHTFCFLPLVAILESPRDFFVVVVVFLKGIRSRVWEEYMNKRKKPETFW
jgi:hypothetical protein